MARKQTVLVVEDDEDLRRLFRTALTLSGYEVEEAGDGLEALHKIDQAPPDLVLLDLMLPQISGFVVQQELAAHVVTRQIPIVVVTGSPGRFDELNAACVLHKPVNPEDLIMTVRKCLARGASRPV